MKTENKSRYSKSRAKQLLQEHKMKIITLSDETLKKLEDMAKPKPRYNPKL